MQVTLEGRDVRIPGDRQRKVLAMLLLEVNQVVGLDRLACAVWDSTPPAGARKLVRNAVSALRRELSYCGKDIVTTDTGYLLRLGPASLDMLAFAQHLDRGRALASAGDCHRAAAEYRSALSLWRGHPLDGLSGPMIAAGATHLAEQWLTSYEEWVDLELALRHHRQLVADLAALVTEYPYRESLVGRLMLALSRSGRQAEALELYRRTRQRLVTELGIEPCAELCQIHRTVLRNGSAWRDPEFVPAAS
jgi:DNA-binding SARP family transcriptional activator